MKKRILTLILAVISIFSFSIFSACGKDRDNDTGDLEKEISLGAQESEGLLYEPVKDTNTCIVKGINNCSDKKIVIPKEIVTGATVVGIAPSAFINCIDIVSIVIPETVLIIGDRAFEGCYKLLEVYNYSQSLDIKKGDIENGYVGFYAEDVYTAENESKLFKNSKGDILYKKDGKKTLISAGETAENVNISNVDYIGNYAFYKNEKIKSVTISNGVEKIGDKAFEFCSNLNSIKLAPSITKIGSEAFSYCKNLESIVFEDESELKTIGANAFSGNILLKNITLPSKLENIGTMAFASCYNLEKIEIPSSVKFISYGAFFDCYNMLSATIHNKDLSIYDGAFTNCYKLVEIYNLSQMVLEKGSTENGSLALYAKDIYTTKEHIESKVINYENGFIVYNGSEKVLIGYNGDNRNIEISGVDLIDNYAFANNDNIVSATIGNVKSIGKEAFMKCTSLSSISISKTVESILEDAFIGCKQLNVIEVEEQNSKYYSLNNCLIERQSQKIIAGGGNALIPTDESVDCIGKYAFSSRENLLQIIIPKNIKMIEEGAFSGCLGLESIFYEGTEEQFSAIEINVSAIPSITSVYYYSSEKPLTDGNYWHYENGEITIW